MNGPPHRPGGKARRTEGVSRLPVPGELFVEAAQTAELSVSIPFVYDAVMRYASSIMRVYSTVLWVTVPKPGHANSGSDE